MRARILMIQGAGLKEQEGWEWRPAKLGADGPRKGGRESRQAQLPSQYDLTRREAKPAALGGDRQQYSDRERRSVCCGQSAEL